MVRYYLQEKPYVSDVVMVRIVSESEYGYMCVLLEYDNIDGYIPLTEIVKRTTKKHVLKIDQILPLVVVDVGDKMVTLSKLQYNPSMSIDEKYRYCTNIIKLLKECAYLIKTQSLTNLMQKILWDNNGIALDDNIIDYKQFFEQIIRDISIILPLSIYSSDEIELLTNNFNSRITRTDCEINIVISLKIYDSNAINIIKNVLNFPINSLIKTTINTASAPQYEVKILCPTIDDGMKYLDKVYEHIHNIVDNVKSEIMISRPKIIDSIVSIKYLNGIQNQ